MSDRMDEDDSLRCPSAALVMPEMVRQCCAYDGHEGEHIWVPIDRQGLPIACTWSDVHADTDTVTIWSPTPIEHNSNGEIS